MTDKSLETLNAKQVGAIINRGEKTVRELLDNGSLPFIRYPGKSRRYVLRGDLVRFMESLRQNENGK